MGQALTTTTAPIEPIDAEQGTSLWRDAWRRLLRNKLAVFGLIVVIIVTISSIVGPTVIKRVFGFTPDYIPSHDPRLTQSFPPFQGPDGDFSWAHPMGTDNAGRDQLARVLQGGQISLFVGILSTLVSLLIGVTYGAIAGYFGGRLDNVMMRIVDVLYSLPFLFFVILLMVYFGRHIVLIFVALGAVEWLTMARIVRGQVLSLKQQNFVEAARALGASDAAIIFRHIVPNSLAPVVVQASLDLGVTLLVAAGLSFIGFGAEPGFTEWGLMISEGREFIAQGFWWMVFFPGLAIMITVLGFNLLGDGLRDKDGRPLAFNLLTSDDPDRIKVAEAASKHAGMADPHVAPRIMPWRHGIMRRGSPLVHRRPTLKNVCTC